MPSITLSNLEDKAKIKRNLKSANYKILTATVVCMFVCVPPNSWKYSGLMGAIVLVYDKSLKTFFFKLIDLLGSNSVVWEQELYPNFVYKVHDGRFHSFCADDYVVGLSFADEKEARSFMKKTFKREQTGEKKTNPEAKKTLFSSFKSQTKPKIDKAMIGKPAAFKHVGHVGYDSVKGFSATHVDPEWRNLFDQLGYLGISEKELQNEKTMKFVHEYIENHGGINKVSKAIKKEAPKPPHSTPSRINNLNKKPPPPPPSKQVPVKASPSKGEFSSKETPLFVPELNTSRHSSSKPPLPPSRKNLDNSTSSKQNTKVNKPPIPTSKPPPPPRKSIQKNIAKEQASRVVEPLDSTNQHNKNTVLQTPQFLKEEKPQILNQNLKNEGDVSIITKAVPPTPKKAQAHYSERNKGPVALPSQKAQVSPYKNNKNSALPPPPAPKKTQTQSSEQNTGSVSHPPPPPPPPAPKKTQTQSSEQNTGSMSHPPPPPPPPAPKKTQTQSPENSTGLLVPPPPPIPTQKHNAVRDLSETPVDSSGDIIPINNDSQRNELLSSIRKGTTLKKVSSVEKPSSQSVEATAQSEDNITGALANLLQNRFQDIAGTESEDDDEWDSE